MNEVEWLKSLEPAGSPPVVDVTAGVMRAVRRQPLTLDTDRVFPIAAVIAALVGIAAATMVAPSWSAPDPFDAFGETVNLVLR